MSSLETTLRSMISENGDWKKMKDDVAADVARRAEEERLNAMRLAEEERQDKAHKAPQVVDQIFAAMKQRSQMGIAEAQRLLGDRRSQESTAKVHREVLGEALVQRVDGHRKHRRTADELYKKLHDFLFAASSGFTLAEELAIAFEQRDAESILRALQYAHEALTDPEQNRNYRSCAAAVALMTYEGDWEPAVWSTQGFETLKVFRTRAEEICALREEISGVPTTAGEPATLKLSKAS